MIPNGKFGFLILNLDINPQKIDVNVHPTKLEIRFQEEQKIFKSIYHTIKEGLLKEDLVKDINLYDNKKTEEENANEYINENKKENENQGNIENLEDDIEIEKDQEDINIIKKDAANKIKISPLFSLFKKREKPEVFIENNKENSVEEIYNNKKTAEENINEYTDKNEKENINANENDTKNIEISNIAEKEEVLKIAEIDETYKEKIKTPTEEQLDYMNNILNMQKLDSDEEKKEEETEEQKEKSKEIKIIEENLKKEFESMYNKTFGKEILDKEHQQKVIEDVDDFKVVNNETISNYKYIGTAFSTYIIIEFQNEIYLIDQHAAHERIMYEKVKNNFYSNANKDSQIMLLPDIINLSYKEREIVRENEELFKNAGFIYEDFGDNTIKLIGVPSLCIDLETKNLFLELLDQIDTVAITATKEKEEKFISTIACKSAVKANMNLSKEEIETLITNLLKLENPFTCPHRKTNCNKT